MGMSELRLLTKDQLESTANTWGEQIDRLENADEDISASPYWTSLDAAAARLGQNATCEQYEWPSETGDYAAALVGIVKFHGGTSNSCLKVRDIRFEPRLGHQIGSRTDLDGLDAFNRKKVRFKTLAKIIASVLQMSENPEYYARIVKLHASSEAEFELFTSFAVMTEESGFSTKWDLDVSVHGHWLQFTKKDAN